jgi:FSR family fosmidomycin resistance protein-like MFS transporter
LQVLPVADGARKVLRDGSANWARSKINLAETIESHPVNHQPKAEFKTAGVLAIAVAHFIHDVYSSFLAPLLPLLIEKLSLSLTQAGFLSTVMQIPALINPMIGHLADRVNLRIFIVLAPATTAVPMSLLGVAPNYAVLLILLFAAGLSTSAFHVPAPVMVAGLSGSRKGRGMSIFMTGGELARAVGPLCAVAAVSIFGLPRFYPVMVIGGLASIWLFVVFGGSTPPVTAQASRSSILESWRALSHLMLPLGAILVFRGFMHGAMATFLPTFVNQQTGNIWLAGSALTVFEAFGVAGVLMAGSMSDHLGRRNTLLISLIGAPIGLLAFTLTGGWLRITMLMLTGFTLLSTTPVMLALVQEQARGRPAAANGFYMMISFLARSAIVVIVGYVADHAGLRNTYLLSAVLGVLAIPFILMLPADR